jgi:hypothetical protein
MRPVVGWLHLAIVRLEGQKWEIPWETVAVSKNATKNLNYRILNRRVYEILHTTIGLDLWQAEVCGVWAPH